MNRPDLVVLILLLVALVWGALQGAARQLAQLVAWVVALAAAWYLSGPAARVLVRMFEAPYGVAYAVSGLVLAFVANLLVRVAFWWPLRQLDKDDHTGSPALSVVNRVLGSAIGGAKMSVLIWSLLSLAALAREPLARVGYALPTSDSGALHFAHEHNLWTMLFQRRLHAIGELATSLMQHAGPEQDEALTEVMSDPRVRALTNDPELRDALEKGDFTRVLQDERVLSLASDDALVERLRDALTGVGTATGVDDATALESGTATQAEETDPKPDTAPVRKRPQRR